MYMRHGDTWRLKELPFITVEPIIMTDNGQAWAACCGGRLVPQIAPSPSSADVMQRTLQYYEERIEISAVQERGLL